MINNKTFHRLQDQGVEHNQRRRTVDRNPAWWPCPNKMVIDKVLKREIRSENAVDLGLKLPDFCPSRTSLKLLSAGKTSKFPAGSSE